MGFRYLPISCHSDVENDFLPTIINFIFLLINHLHLEGNILCTYHVLCSGLLDSPSCHTNECGLEDVEDIKVNLNVSQKLMDQLGVPLTFGI